MTDPRTGPSATHYNAQGQVDWVQDAAGHRTAYVYDPATGQRIASSNAVGEVRRSHYDAQGRLLAEWEDGYPVRYEYESQGRVEAMFTLRDPTVRIASCQDFQPGRESRRLSKRTS